MSSLIFPKGYFEDEIREDFKIEAMVKRSWAAQLEVVKVVSEICDKYGLQYFGFWGTLLGTVRHKGFIPWDDDLDIIMKRKDYDKFFEVAKYELPEGFVILSPYDEVEWNEQVSRVVNSHSIRFGEEFLSKYHGFPFAAGIDIFPYDYLPDNEELCTQKDALMSRVVGVRNAVKARQELIEENQYHNEIDDVINAELDYLEDIFEFEFNREIHLANQLLCLYDQIAASFGNENDRYLTCYAERAKRREAGGDFKIPAYWFDEAVDYPFECTTIKIPKYYELCLSQCYGKRFMIPIKSGISGHDYPFFDRQLATLREVGRYDEVMDAVKNSEKNEVYAENFEAAKKANGIIEEHLSDEDALDIIRGVTNDYESFSAEAKKTILFNISEMDFYNNEEKVVNKVENALKTMKENKDKINLIFADSKVSYEVLRRKDQRLEYRYIQLVKNYKTEGWGIYIDSSQINDYINVCDAFYGSSNEHIKPFMINHKPVMICNPDC